ncbi:hypothetical protein K2X92_01235 [Candidatus Gracilibacteria bacterium]|nr:hypothetical protein [Candidatus Gracilibacteria bacterium]
MEKLIRDKIHLNPHTDYQNMQIRNVDNVIEHIGFLIKKIREETLEFEKAEGNNKVTEAGDLLEVYDTLIDLYEITHNQIEREKSIHSRETLLETIHNIGISVDLVLKTQETKRIEKGGFRNGIVWIYN